eukprot:1854452-Rhodomonas_salina.1
MGSATCSLFVGGTADSAASETCIRHLSTGRQRQRQRRRQRQSQRQRQRQGQRQRQRQRQGTLSQYRTPPRAYAISVPRVNALSVPDTAKDDRLSWYTCTGHRRNTVCRYRISRSTIGVYAVSVLDMP